MAKENHVLLIGELQGPPIINEETNKAKYVVKTLRRNDKIDYPIISVFGPNLVEKVKGFKEKDFIIIKGFLATQEVNKGVVCPHCQEVRREEGTTTEIAVIDNINIGPNHKLEELKEVSNTIMILGSLCRDVEFRMLANTGISSTQYQIAANRKFNSGRGHSTTDYPWVNSFGRQAEQDAKRLEQGSQVFVQGGVQTRNVHKTITCNECNNEFKAEDFVAEIVPYSVEYLNNCKFDDE